VAADIPRAAGDEYFHVWRSFFFDHIIRCMAIIGNYSGQLLRFVARSAGNIDFPVIISDRGAFASPAPPGCSENRRRKGQSRSVCSYAQQPT